MPFRHEEQPQAAQKSHGEAQGPMDIQPKFVTSIDFWYALLSALAACISHLRFSRQLAQTPQAQEWMRIIVAMGVTLQGTSAKLEERIGMYRGLEKSPGYDKFKRFCRAQADRLRQLRGKALRHLTERPSDVDAECAPGVTFDGHVRQTLTSVLEACSKTSKMFLQQVDDAAAKAKGAGSIGGAGLRFG